jgi:hypothetical protein
MDVWLRTGEATSDDDRCCPVCHERLESRPLPFRPDLPE